MCIRFIQGNLKIPRLGLTSHLPNQNFRWVTPRHQHCLFFFLIFQWTIFFRVVFNSQQNCAEGTEVYIYPPLHPRIAPVFLKTSTGLGNLQVVFAYVSVFANSDSWWDTTLSSFILTATLWGTWVLFSQTRKLVSPVFTDKETKD